MEMKHLKWKYSVYVCVGGFVYIHGRNGINKLRSKMECMMRRMRGIVQTFLFGVNLNAPANATRQAVVVRLVLLTKQHTYILYTYIRDRAWETKATNRMCQKVWLEEIDYSDNHFISFFKTSGYLG